MAASQDASTVNPARERIMTAFSFSESYLQEKLSMFEPFNSLSLVVAELCNFTAQSDEFLCVVGYAARVDPRGCPFKVGKNDLERCSIESYVFPLLMPGKITECESCL
jgi:hypothetical protein